MTLITMDLTHDSTPILHTSSPTRLTWISGTVQADATLLGLDEVTSYFSSESLPAGLRENLKILQIESNRIIYRIMFLLQKRGLPAFWLLCGVRELNLMASEPTPGFILKGHTVHPSF